MNILSRLKNVYKIGLAFGLFAVAISGTNLIANRLSPASAANACKTINVIYCGLSGSATSGQITSLKSFYNNNTSNTSGSGPVYKDIKTIYNYMGASQALIDGMNTSNTIVGYVWRSGHVTNASGEIIATNAMSVGRFYTPSSVLISGTNAYVRPTTESFADVVIQAIVRLDSNGNMLFASLLECGNPIKATPVVKPKPVIPVVVAPTVTPKLIPDYEVVKEVALKGSTSYAPSITVNYGTHVVYRITVTSTGTAPVTSLGVYDTLPSSVQYVNYTIKHDGAGYATSFFSSGIRISSLPEGTSTNFTYEVIVGPNDTATSCTPETVTNTASTSIMAVMQPTKSSTATVNKTCIPPVVTPTPTTKNPIVATTVTPTPVVSTITPTPTATPVTAVCTNLSLLTSTLNPRLVTATASYTASTGVALTNVSFNWNDGYLTNNGVTTSAQHTYAVIGTYVVTASLSFSNGSTALPVSSCQASVTFSAVTPPVITPIVPTVLPNTGPGSVAMLFAGVSAIGTFGYRLFLGRRLAGMIAD